MANTKPSLPDQVIRWASTISVIVLAGIVAVNPFHPPGGGLLVTA